MTFQETLEDPLKTFKLNKKLRTIPCLLQRA